MFTCKRISFWLIRGSHLNWQRTNDQLYRDVQNSMNYPSLYRTVSRRSLDVPRKHVTCLNWGIHVPNPLPTSNPIPGLMGHWTTGTQPVLNVLRQISGSDLRVTEWLLYINSKTTVNTTTDLQYRKTYSNRQTLLCRIT